MKPMKTIIISTLIIGTVALGASAYANRGGDRFQNHMIEKITKRLELTDTQVMALDNLVDEVIETRQLMKGDGENMRTEISGLVASDTFDQGKALSMINDRAAALQNNAPELVAAAAVFFDGLDSTQKEEINNFAEQMHKGRRH